MLNKVAKIWLRIPVMLSLHISYCKIAIQWPSLCHPKQTASSLLQSSACVLTIDVIMLLILIHPQCCSSLFICSARYQLTFTISCKPFFTILSRLEHCQKKDWLRCIHIFCRALGMQSTWEFSQEGPRNMSHDSAGVCLSDSLTRSRAWKSSGREGRRVNGVGRGTLRGIRGNSRFILIWNIK